MIWKLSFVTCFLIEGLWIINSVPPFYNLLKLHNLGIKGQFFRTIMREKRKIILCNTRHQVQTQQLMIDKYIKSFNFLQCFITSFWLEPYVHVRQFFEILKTLPNFSTPCYTVSFWTCFNVYHTCYTNIYKILCKL